MVGRLVPRKGRDGGPGGSRRFWRVSVMRIKRGMRRMGARVYQENMVERKDMVGVWW